MASQFGVFPVLVYEIRESKRNWNWGRIQILIIYSQKYIYQNMFTTSP